MKPISFQSKASVVYSVTTALFIEFLPEEAKCVSPMGRKQMTIWSQQNKSPGIEMLINFLC